MSEVFAEEFMEPLNYSKFGVGLNSSRYSDFLAEQKDIAGDSYIQCHGYHGGSIDEGVVTFDTGAVMNNEDIPWKQYVTVYFNEVEDKPFDYSATVSVDALVDEELDKDTLLRMFAGPNRVEVPVTGSSNVVIDPVVEPVPFPDDEDRTGKSFDRGVRLSHTINIGRCTGGIGMARMEQIFALSMAILFYVLDTINSADGKEEG